MPRRTYAGDHSEIASSLNNVGYCLEQLEDLDDALAKYREAVGIWERVLPGDHRDITTARSNMARCLFRLERYAEALPEFLEVHRALESRADSQVATRRRVLESLIKLFEAWETAEPNRGHAESAADWQEKLDALGDEVPASSLLP
jgi:tetratricopeptide (TPR) repeat protein